MIAGFRDVWLGEFFLEDRHTRKIPPDIKDRLFRKLQLIDDATTDADLRVPPSNHFEKLRGSHEGLHSIRVNQQWRLVFRWDGEPMISISTTTAVGETHVGNQARAGNRR